MDTLTIANQILPSGFTLGEYIPGFTPTMGKSAGKLQNWAYHAKDIVGRDCIFMYCHPNTFTILDSDVLEKIRKVEGKEVSWYFMKVGYVACHINKKILYLHSHLMNHFGHGKGQESVDHINQNKLDNRLENLRITSQSVQNSNRGKCNRKYNAKKLPDGLTQEDLPKYVVYYTEKLPSGNIREFFRVEKHPIQNKKQLGEITNDLILQKWATTKSNKYSIHEKLEQAKAYVTQLDSFQITA
jgi:hypothetical protein